MKTDKLPKAISIVLILAFLLMQFAYLRMNFSGGWCSPYFGAPKELGHPAFQFSNYGFPVTFMTFTRDECFTAQSTTYEWNPIGLLVDGILLVLLAFPFWRTVFKKNLKE